MVITAACKRRLSLACVLTPMALRCRYTPWSPIAVTPANVSAPLLVVVGSDDCTFPSALPWISEPLYRGAASKRKALLVLTGADHCGFADEQSELEVAACKLWVGPQNESHGSGSIPGIGCHGIAAQQQQDDALQLLGAFADAVAGGGSWGGFEAMLAAGEKRGKWSYATQASPPTKRPRNACPCAKAEGGRLAEPSAEAGGGVAVPLS